MVSRLRSIRLLAVCLALALIAALTSSAGARAGASSLPRHGTSAHAPTSTAVGTHSRSTSGTLSTKPSGAATAPSGSGGLPGGVSVYVGYADSTHASAAYPNPWVGSPAITTFDG